MATLYKVILGDLLLKEPLEDYPVSAASVNQHHKGLHIPCSLTTIHFLCYFAVVYPSINSFLSNTEHTPIIPSFHAIPVVCISSILSSLRIIAPKYFVSFTCCTLSLPLSPLYSFTFAHSCCENVQRYVYHSC